VTLGILPAIGGLVVPYRRWPQGSAVFHDVLRLGRRLTAEEAQRLGIVNTLAEDYHSLIQAAVDGVREMRGKIPRIPDGPVEIAPLQPIEEPMAGDLRLSQEVVGIISEAIRGGARASSFEAALDLGYRAFGEVSCTEAAREGITAFLAKRAPEFRK
jgi:enoyl-CoA hydratase/3-hydroxyacyl-CoA dehydrogenase